MPKEERKFVGAGYYMKVKLQNSLIPLVVFLNVQFAGPPVVEAVLEPLEAAVTHQRVARHP